MKTNKRTLAMLTAGLLALTPCFTAGMLTAEAATITVNKVTGDTAAHSYKAYPIITGTLDTTGTVLSNMTWSSGISLSTLETELKALDSTFSTFDATTTTPEQFAAMANTYANTDAKKQALAKVFNETGVITGLGTALSDGDNTANPYTATGLADGWYVIIDESASSSLEHSAYSANILEVKGSAAINPKYSLPTLDKQIVSPDPNSTNDANTASIGDIITYTINLKVPDTTGYNKYFYVVNDTLSKGLTYVGTTSVTIDGHELTLDTEPESSESGKYNVTVGTYDSTNGTTIKYVFEDFLNYVQNTADVAPGDDIVITYTAQLNNNAVIGSEGNPNTATLTYSNNPNHTYEGTPGTTPDEPDSEEPKGTTPPDTVKTYTTEIQIEKVELGNTTHKLSGATFQLTGTSLNAVLHEGGLYQKNSAADPAYYLLKNGTYTTDVPTPSTGTDYESDQKYELVPTSTLTNNEVKVTAFGTTDGSGLLTFSGLGAGKYTIKELTAPDGYNLLTEPITITIGTESGSPTANSCTWTYKKGSDTASTSNTIQIENAQGATLPSTGGIGTKLFYLFGGMLVVGSSVVLITKKRMSADEK